MLNFVGTNTRFYKMQGLKMTKKIIGTKLEISVTL